MLFQLQVVPWSLKILRGGKRVFGGFRAHHHLEYSVIPPFCGAELDFKCYIQKDGYSLERIMGQLSTVSGSTKDSPAENIPLASLLHVISLA